MKPAFGLGDHVEARIPKDLSVGSVNCLSVISPTYGAMFHR